jgi:peptidoglycan/LPS O-acetylase OafA/YrhL
MSKKEMTLTSTGSADSHVIRYRADIDGLRAIAVMSVVIYHLSRFALPGGYLGVDMFFVLSGYLITIIIWREAQDGRFSISRFYDRRIRRIMPALLLMLFLTMIASTVLLLPADLVGYSKSMLATLGFVANIFFWRDTDYFSLDAENKPLLHMWSLGVEEQFYLIFPLIIALFARFWPRNTLLLLLLIITLTMGSLSVNMLALNIGGASPAFFLLPTRAWELGLGAIIALLPPHVAQRFAQANLVAVIGAVLVIVSLFYPIRILPILPNALPTVIGTAILILTGQHHHSTVNRLLSARPLVLVGLISYSLYLWHWPIIIFSQYYLLRHLNLPEMAAALGLMIIFARCETGVE